MRRSPDPAWRGALLPVLLLAGPLFADRAAAHDLAFVSATLTLRADGSFRLDLLSDLDARLVGVAPGGVTHEMEAALGELSTEQWDELLDQLRAYFERSVRMDFDDVQVHFEVDFPEHETALALPSTGAPLPGHTARLSGVWPLGAESLVFRASRALGPVTLRVNFPDAARAPHVQAMPAGAASLPVALSPAAPPQPWWAVLGQYLILGFEHILPKGLDHILFVLSLFLLSSRTSALLWQVTMFTIAHSITLALAMYEVVSLPSSVVEPLIALSIACVASENVVATRLSPWRPAVVFAFGLLHGLGFAGVLTELGLPRGDFAVALAGFNVGVEAGQLAVLVLALAAVGWFRRAKWYRPRLAVPASCLIAMVGLFWAVQRTFGMD
ncbi:MAG: hypothetical protein CHACPFDD_01793 [Phycisphaerae bacterium]|nr:hypothetical protein [Phycisphaerae bacterium]